MKTARYLNGNIDPQKHVPLAISMGLPKFCLSYPLKDRIYILAPSRDILQIADPVEYQKKYCEQLERYGVEKIKRILLREQERDKENVLLCFEDIRKPGLWCHRRMFAEWFERKTGVVIDELEEPESPTVRKGLDRAAKQQKTQPERLLFE